MKSKPSEISTVIIVNKSREPQTLQVKTKHISRLRHYAAMVIGVIVLLSGSIIYLRSVNQQQEQEKDKLVAQLTKLKNTLPAPATTPSSPEKKAADAQSYIQSIQENSKKSIVI